MIIKQLSKKSPLFKLFGAGLFITTFIFSCSFPKEQANKSKHAMVVSAHPLASEIGLQIIKNGGNAVDAAVAVQFALAVVYPSAGNIGGGGFFVYRSNLGECSTLDFREKAPLNAQRDMYLDTLGNVVDNLSLIGHLAVGVPGTVDGMVTIHEKYGRLSWGKVIQPSIDLANNGFVLTEKQASNLNYFNKSKLNFNDYNPYFKDTYNKGDTLLLRDLGNTLIQIRGHKREGFYKGVVADQIVEEMQKNNGLIDHDDLESYRSVWREPIVFPYQKYNIITMGPPSSGGIVLAQLMKMTSIFDVAKMGFHSHSSVHLMSEIERRAFADRSKYLGDPDFYDIPQDQLLDSIYLIKRLNNINLSHATPSDSVHPGELLFEESDETTHFSIVDEDGNAVSITTTLNGSYGSGVIVDGAGFLLNNEMDDFSIKPGYPNLYGLIGGEANAIAPEKRMLSSMTPSIVEKNDSLYLVVGSPGGSAIITAVYQTLLNVIEFEMSIDSAVNSPRFHHQWKPDQIKMEQSLSKNQILIDALKNYGHHIKYVSSMNRVDAILVKNDSLFGGADRRGDDFAAGY